jgi:hypothetical protein
MANTAYHVLGVPRNASDEAIKAAFYKAAKACHPDLNPGDRTAEMRQANAAYQVLKSPERRAAYDRYLKNHRRERIRRFTAPVVAGLASGSCVALAVWLAVTLWHTPGVFGPPEATGIAAAMASPSVSPQVAATAGSGVRHDTSDGRTGDRDAVEPNGRLAEQVAGLNPPAEPALSPLATDWEWEQVQASGDPRAIWAFAVRNPGTAESNFARAKLIALLDATEDVSLLHVLRLVATDAIAERAQQRLARLSAVPAAKADGLVSDAPSSRSPLRASAGEAAKARNREEPVAPTVARGSRIAAKRQVTNQAPHRRPSFEALRQASSENSTAAACSGQSGLGHRTRPSTLLATAVTTIELAQTFFDPLSHRRN